MRWNGYKRMIGGTVSALCMICVISSNVVFAAAKGQVDHALEKIRYTNDGGETTLHMNGPERLEVTLNTKSLDVGYYTSSLYVNGEVKIREGQTITLTIATKKQVSMNVNLTDEKGKTYVCEDETQVFLKEKGNQVYQTVAVENGTFHLPKGFRGDVCIPADLVASKKQLEKVRRLSFIFVETEGQESSFTIEGLSIHGNTHAVSKLSAKGYQIVGKDTVGMPSNGEYVYQYEVLSKDDKKQPCEVSLEEKVSGVTISKEGLLTVTDTAKEKTIHLVFTLLDGTKLGYSVNVGRPMYEGGQEVSLNIIVPTKAEVTQYKDGLDHKKKAEMVDYVLRMSLILGMAGYLVFYSKKIRQK